MTSTKFAGLLFVTIFASAAVHAQTMYVTDELVITVRTGPSTQNSITANLSSGDEVELLEQDQESGYSRVRLAGSEREGWVLTRYLMDNPTADQALSQTQRELNAARARIETLEEQLQATTVNLEQTRAELGDSQSTAGSISAELEDIRTAAANAIEIRDQNESLRRRNSELTIELELLTQESARLASRSRQNWFVVGALVLASGIVVGLVAPSLRRKRRTDW